MEIYHPIQSILQIKTANSGIKWQFSKLLKDGHNTVHSYYSYRFILQNGKHWYKITIDGKSFKDGNLLSNPITLMELSFKMVNISDSIQ